MSAPARIALHVGDTVTDRTLNVDGTVVELVEHLELVRVYWRPSGDVNAYYPEELLRIV